jgi:hypothetical protein
MSVEADVQPEFAPKGPPLGVLLTDYEILRVVARRELWSVLLQRLPGAKQCNLVSLSPLRANGKNLRGELCRNGGGDGSLQT